MNRNYYACMFWESLCKLKEYFMQTIICCIQHFFTTYMHAQHCKVLAYVHTCICIFVHPRLHLHLHFSIIGSWDRRYDKLTG